jgi:hypothetical protein
VQLASALRVLFLTALSCALAPLASAQEKHVFSADKDLPGFEAAGFSEWNDVYALAEFKASDGKELDAAALEALRARWKAEQERAQKRIAEIEADPRERWTWIFGRRLARHSYFSKIAYTIERPEPGYVIVVQRPAKDEPGYAARVTGFYMPFVKRMAANFDALVAKPAGLARREDQPVTAFAVLASKGDLENYERMVSDPAGYSSGTVYDYQMQLAATYENPFAGTSVVMQRASLLYQLAKELQHAHLAVTGNRPGSIWLYEGLSLLLAMHDGSTPESLDKHVASEGTVDWVAGLLQKEPAREILLMPADELAQLRDFDEYRIAVLAHAKRMQTDSPAEEDIDHGYYAQCELWAHFLVDGAQGTRRKAFTEFLKLAFRGKGDAADLRRAFAGTDPRALSREFLGWVCAEFERLHPGQKADRSAIAALFPGSAQPEAAASPSADAAAPAVDPAFSPQVLAPAPDDLEAQLALALRQAREGDLAGALSALGALAAQAKGPPWAERIARESARVAELVKLRDGYLAFLVSSGGKLTLKRGGKDVPVPVAGIENGSVRLGENKLGLASVPLAEVDPFEIAKVASKKEAQGGAQPWARFYAYVLAGDARWEKLLKDDSPAARELRADAKDYHPQLARTGGVARELCELSKLPLPGGAADARASLERVKRLLAVSPRPELVALRLAALRQLAGACLAQVHSAGDAAGLLHCKSEPLPDGRTSFTWEFDSPEEAADWRRQAGYLKNWRERFPKITVAEPDSRFQVEKGQFRGTGQVCYRSIAGFTGPITVRVRYRYLSDQAEHTPPAFYVMICDDGEGSFIVGGDPGFLRVHDAKKDYEREAHSTEGGSYSLDQDVDFEIVHDGKEVSTALDKQPLTKIGCGPRKSGSVVLFAHLDLALEIDRIVIEGQLLPASLRELQSRWVAEQLAALGFP